MTFFNLQPQNDWQHSEDKNKYLITSSLTGLKQVSLSPTLSTLFMMLRTKLPFGLLVLVLTFCLFPDACIARIKHKHCKPSFCGNINISYPFRLKTQPSKCGYDQRFELECEKNRTTFPMEYGSFYVLDISYASKTLRLLDASLDKENCAIPRSSIPLGEYPLSYDLKNVTYVVNCLTKMNSSVYVDASRCRANDSSSPRTYFYFLDSNTKKSDFNQSCTVEAQFPTMLPNVSGLSTSSIYKILLEGVQVSWYTPSNRILDM